LRAILPFSSQSFAKLFGEELLEYLHPTDVEDWTFHSCEKEETRDPSAVLQDAKGALLVWMSTRMITMLHKHAAYEMSR
jgi:hypothetical protein